MTGKRPKGFLSLAVSGHFYLHHGRPMIEMKNIDALAVKLAESPERWYRVIHIYRNYPFIHQFR